MLLYLKNSTVNEPLPPVEYKNFVLADLKLEFIRGGRSLSSVYNTFISLVFTDQRSLWCIFASQHGDREEGLRAEDIEKKELRKGNSWIEKKKSAT